MLFLSGKLQKNTGLKQGAFIIKAIGRGDEIYYNLMIFMMKLLAMAMMGLNGNRDDFVTNPIRE
jgi:hypothetical protein